MLARSVSLISSVSKLTSRLLHTNIHVMCPHLIKMPCVTHHMTEGELARWCKKDGDTIKPHDLICEVRTDKTLYGMENEEEEDWLLVKTLCCEGQTKKVNDPIGMVAYEDEDWEEIMQNWEVHLKKLLEATGKKK